MACHLSLSELGPLLRDRKLSSRELTQSCLDRIQAVDSKVRAFLHCDPEDALAQADAADARLAHLKGSPASPLLGIPVAMKDLFAVKDQPLTCASKILQHFVSPYDATVTERLKQAGAVVFGRLNMDEFAMGSSTENSAFHPTSNPWDLTRIPGGSSGGAAAAVVADECIASLGTDTGGSIRQPASFCGCVGLKPTYGRVSRYGMVAFASSLDQAGPMTKTVADAATVLETIGGHDPRDSTSLPEPVPKYRESLGKGIKGMRLGVPREYMVAGMNAEVHEALRRALAQLESLGAELREISLPHTDYAVAAYYIVATAEASANLARYDGIRYGLRIDGPDTTSLYEATRGAGFGSEVKRRILLGTYALSSGYYDAFYLKAQKVRQLIHQDFKRAFDDVDAVVAPTCPTPAFKIGEKAGDPLAMYLSDIFTLSCNLAGLCGISVPCGFSTNPKLPIGLQFLGPPLGEPAILGLAHAYEQSTGWHLEKPPLPLPGLDFSRST